MNNRGNLIVLSGPSGCGKGTMLKCFFEKYPNEPVRLSVSATTRSPREGEADGINYYFIDEDKFRSLIAEDGFLEWACFCGNYYGTLKDKVISFLDEGTDIILEIEVQGAANIKSRFPDACTVFVLPPSFEELNRRLTGRGTEPEDVVEQRINTAREEIRLAEKYDYILINEDVEETAGNFRHIIAAERLKTKNNINNIKEVCKS